MSYKFGFENEEFSDKIGYVKKLKECWRKYRKISLLKKL